MNNPESQSLPHLAREFVTTHWSVILLAGGADSAQADTALEHFCRAYQDLTQDFFARFLERKHRRLADRERGRFRTFLLSSLKNF